MERALFFGFARVSQVETAGREVGDAAHGFTLGPHGHQHAMNVGMILDRLRADLIADDASFNSFSCIGARRLIRALRDANALHRDAQTRLIHHDEHVFEAATFRAHKIADATTIVAE